MDLMFQPLKKYADFQGRARRSEYWLFRLFEAVLLLAVVVLVAIVGAAGNGSDAAAGIGGMIFLVYLIFLLGMIIPSLAVTVRRLHDSGQSGWMLLLAFVPFIGGIVLLIFTLIDGTAGANQYGPDPKGRGIAQTFA